MKYHGVSREFGDFFFIYFKKHSCPKCGNELKPVKVSEIVDSKSEKAKDFDFSSEDVYLKGKIKFIWAEFKCADCGKQYTVNYIKNINNK